MQAPIESVSLASSLHAETIASVHASASCYRFAEYVGLFPVVKSELKFREVQRQILAANVVIGADDSAFQQSPKSFDAVRMDDAAHVAVIAMPDDFMRAPAMSASVS